MYYFEISYLLTDLKNFLKAPLAPICTNFEGGACAKERDFLVQIFQKKSLKTRFFKNFGHISVSKVVWESSENQFIRPKKMS